MPLADLTRPWSGVGYRHIPAGAAYDVLDFRFAGLSAINRWNVQGEPTLYLAGDPKVALAEFARHLDDDRAPALRQGLIARALFRLHVQVDDVLDLRDPALQRELSLQGAPACFLERRIARATAQFLRQTTPAQALLVPSVAFLDDPAAWSLILFLDKLPAQHSRFIAQAEAAGSFRLDPPP